MAVALAEQHLTEDLNRLWMSPGSAAWQVFAAVSAAAVVQKMGLVLTGCG